MPDMKRFVSALLALLMLLVQLSALAEETSGDGPVYPLDSLTVGNTTRLDGRFFTEMWGNVTSDYDVRQLIHGYSLAEWDGSKGMFVLNPQAVTGSAVTEDAQKNKTYHLTLARDLYYSDGSRITAADYAFTLLLTVNPVIAELNGKPLHRDHIKGCRDYAEGKSKVLSGVRLVNDHALDITLSAEYLPFFYEVGLLECIPSPIKTIAPGCKVRDDGQGVYIANADAQAEEPLFTAENLSKTLLDDPETGRFGYISHPTVVSGPYTLTSYDGTTAEFDLNPFYKGNRDGSMPAIAHITYTLADNETMMADLESGRFGLLNKVTRADAVARGREMQTAGSWAMTAYPRSGLSFLNFSCERPIPASKAVRQAVAFCLDKAALTRAYVGENGEAVDGWFGIGQWMVQVLRGGLPYPVVNPGSASSAAQKKYDAIISEWKALNMSGIRTYSLRPDRAEVLLENDGWTLNGDGAAWQKGTDDVRYKQTGAGLIPLELVLAYPEGNAIGDALQAHLVPWAAQSGIRIVLQPMAMTDLLDQLYRRQERTVDMIYMATNFEVLYDPAVHFSADADGAPIWSYTGLADATLYQLADDLSHTEPADYLTYVRRWLAFQEHFSELQPAIPIYSNQYFDFYTVQLHDYDISSSVSWSQAIKYAHLEDR